MAISLDSITYTIHDGSEDVTILNDITFSLEDSSAAFITGKSGSGKSTLLGLAGLLKKTQHGTISIDGQPVNTLSSAQQSKIRKNKIGFIFQTSNLFPSLSALEQLEIVAHINSSLNQQTKQQAKELLDVVGLSHRLNNKPAELSGGERQRVAIARAFMNNPSIIIADEPTASLDDERGTEILELLVNQTSERKCATMIVTHNISQIPEGSLRYTLDKGNLEV